MRNFFYIAALILLLTNCTSNTIISKPKNLIPKDKMVDVITDMLLASGGENIKNIHMQRKVDYFPLVYEKYQIDSTQFKESNFYYVSRIDDFEEILEKVDKRLSKLRLENETAQNIKDSIKNIDPELKKLD
ncbi:DUF4296 domain-containing protein [Lutibacter sp. HS1-25]|uniref:DUF4296 domain-containing protein n=1 Tax=Lutibacter sp. HS1-25 TaxID=2485000 RepID=UPI0010137CAB|nr:DUF4296 domain-containing protein [Lutibacter sp. HS1-25]RXP59473.1 DUF4296 domain-containing protein [Lutibacter sp. HS1-25]